MKTKAFLITLIAMLSVSALVFQSCKKDEEKSNELPTCKIIAPANNQELVKGETVIISVEANDSDGNITEVSFAVDGVVKGSASSYPYNYDWSTNNESIGSHIIKTTSIDNGGSSSFDEITIELTENGGGEPCPGTPTITDVDGNVYNTVQIGGQCWMKENLRVGIHIDSLQEMTSNSMVEKYCYEGDIANCETYGGLYQWDEMMQYTTTSGVQGICPSGWHLPSDGEWTILSDFLRGEGNPGGEMKEIGTAHWWFPNAGATNTSGFTALPGSLRSIGGSFYDLYFYGLWWSSTEHSGTDALSRGLVYDQGQVHRSHFNKARGLSARCLKN